MIASNIESSSFFDVYLSFNLVGYGCMNKCNTDDMKKNEHEIRMVFPGVMKLFIWDLRYYSSNFSAQAAFVPILPIWGLYPWGFLRQLARSYSHRGKDSLAGVRSLIPERSRGCLTFKRPGGAHNKCIIESWGMIQDLAMILATISVIIILI